MTRIVLIRHGETDVTGRTLTGRASGVHLNARGRQQAQRVAEHLDGVAIAAIWSSPLERAQQTAGPMAGRRGLAVAVHEGLHELDIGDWQGRDIEALEPDPVWAVYNQWRSIHRPPGGESIAEAQVRMVRTAQSIAEAFPGETVAAVGHCDPIRALLAHALGVPLDLFGRLAVAPASVSVVEIGGSGEPGEPRVLCLNEGDGFGSLRHQ